MKKTVITRKRIQQMLLTSLNRRITLIIVLSAFDTIGIIAYVLNVYNFANGIYIKNSVAVSVFSLAIGIISLLLISVVLLKFYYIDLVKIKRNQFEITEDELCQKAKENIRYYHHSEPQNSLYFRLGRIAATNEVYSYSKVGDRFYIVVLNSKKKVPRLVFHTKYYEIEK